MGIGICDKCVKKYYPLKIGKGTGLGWAAASCAKCGAFWVRGYYGGLTGIKGFEEDYRKFIQWLPKHRKCMGKRKGVLRLT